MFNKLTMSRIPSVVEQNTTESFKTVAKWSIAAVVAVGLVFATRQSIDQWQTESAKLQSEIDTITQRLADSVIGQDRAELERAKEQLQRSLPRVANLHWGKIGLAALFYGIGLVPASFVLRRALAGLDEHPRLGTTIAAQLLGHAGKYVPGKAMVIVLRIGALSVDGVKPMATTIAVFVETFMMMAVGAAVAGFVVLWLPVPAWIMALALMFALLASVPTSPPILKRVATRIAKVDVAELDSPIGSELVIRGWCWSLLAWLMLGASFALLISALPAADPMPPTIQLYAIATAAISLAMVVGFASLLPGGAGVRELVLITVLGVSLGTAHGLLAAIAHRIMSIIVECVLACGSWLWLRYTARTGGLMKK
jgi:uncharacterized membrane protein YbhN (UPF0104 family)